MIIEHDGKRIDTEKEIRDRLTKREVLFVGKSCKTDRAHCIWVEYQSSPNVWEDWFVSERTFVSDFENVPQKHERWYVVSPDSGYASEADAARDAKLYPNYVVAKAEWEF